MYIVNANQLVNLIQNIVSKCIVISFQDTVYENEMNRATNVYAIFVHMIQSKLSQHSLYEYIYIHVVLHQNTCSI